MSSRSRSSWTDDRRSERSAGSSRATVRAAASAVQAVFTSARAASDDRREDRGPRRGEHDRPHANPRAEERDARARRRAARRARREPEPERGDERPPGAVCAAPRRGRAKYRRTRRSSALSNTAPPRRRGRDPAAGAPRSPAVPGRITRGGRRCPRGVARNWRWRPSSHARTVPPGRRRRGSHQGTRLRANGFGTSRAPRARFRRSA